MFIVHCINKTYTAQSLGAINLCVMQGSGCGSVGKAVASDCRGPAVRIQTLVGVIKRNWPF